MSDKVYDINFGKLVEWLVPPILRRPKMVAWLAALVSPVTKLYQQFLRYRAQKLYELAITPQVCYLERLLNDKYDFIERRIRIEDGLDKLPTFYFVRGELKPVHMYRRSEDAPTILYTRGESGDIKDDFIILVPMDISFIELEMRTLVIAYKLAATKFKIQRV
jgi:hypothetical protein